MSFLSSLLELKFRFSAKQLAVLVICVLFIQYKCADASGDDEEEEEEEFSAPTSNVTTPEQYAKDPENVDTLVDLPKTYLDNSVDIPKNQFTVIDFAKPKRNSKNRMSFKARNILFGDYSFLPTQNLWLVLMKMLLSLTANKRRERRMLEESEVGCRNTADIPNKQITDEITDFECESTTEPSDDIDIDKAAISVKEIAGEEAPSYIADINLSDQNAEMADKNTVKENTLQCTITDIDSIGSSQIVMSGENCSSLSEFSNKPFSLPIETPKSVASCSINGNNKLVCSPDSTLTRENIESSGGIQFNAKLTLSGDGIQVARRLQSGKTLYLKTSSDGAKLAEGEEAALRTPGKSSGLSGGAIAGIIIACAAVLIGGILAALLCRKTTTSTALYTTGTQDNLAIEQKPVYY